MEGLVVVEEGDDTQAHRAQQEHPVPPHFHPGTNGKGRDISAPFTSTGEAQVMRSNSLSRR